MVVISGLLVVWWLNIPFLDSPKDNAPTIVTSTPILADLTQQLMGPDVKIVSLTDRVSDPASQTISEQKIDLLKKADLVLLNGDPIDQKINVATQVNRDAQVLNVGELMGKYEKNWSQYYWMNPVKWNRLVHYLQIQFKRVFPNRRSEINYRKMAYTNDIYVLHKGLKEGMDELKKSTKVLCSNHESLAVFAKAFGFEFVPITLSKDMDEAALNDVVDALKKNNVKIIYPNDAIPQDGIDDLVKAAVSQGWQLQVGPPVFSLNLDVDGSGVDSYMDMMTFNLRAITDS